MLFTMIDFALRKMLSLDSMEVLGKINASWLRGKRMANDCCKEVLPSAMVRSSFVVIKSADTVIFVCLASAIANSRLARSLGWHLALSPYDIEDLLVMPLDMRCPISYQGLELWCVKRSWPGKSLVSFGPISHFWARK